MSGIFGQAKDMIDEAAKYAESITKTMSPTQISRLSLGLSSVMTKTLFDAATEGMEDSQKKAFATKLTEHRNLLVEMTETAFDRDTKKMGTAFLLLAIEFLIVLNSQQPEQNKEN